MDCLFSRSALWQVDLVLSKSWLIGGSLALAEDVGIFQSLVISTSVRIRPFGLTLLLVTSCGFLTRLLAGSISLVDTVIDFPPGKDVGAR